MEQAPDVFAGIFGIVAICFFYFLPAINAWARGHHNTGAIFAFNLLLAWTFVGWAIALVWSCTAVNPALAKARAAS